MEPVSDTGFDFWTAKRVRKATGYSRVTLWRKSRDPDDDFPAPHQLSANRVAWRSDQVMAWLESRPRVNYAPEHQAT